MGHSKMKRFGYVLGSTLTVICSVYFFQYLIRYWHVITEVQWDLQAWLVAGLSLILYLIASLATIAVWWIFLQTAGERISYYSAMRITLLAQFGKYLPGNVGHHIGRVVLAKKSGMNIPRVMFSIAVETVWAVTVTALLTLACVLAVGDRWLIQFSDSIPSVKEMYVIFVVILLLFGILYWLVRRWNQWKRDACSSANRINMPDVSAYMKTMMLIIGNFLIMGFVLYILGMQVFDLNTMDYLLVTAAFVVSWTIGFVTPGAPAGLGIREILLVGMLGSLGVANAVAIAALLRLITVLGDGVMFVAGLILKKQNYEK